MLTEILIQEFIQKGQPSGSSKCYLVRLIVSGLFILPFLFLNADCLNLERFMDLFHYVHASV